MRIRYQVLLCIAAMLAAFQPVSAQWAQTNGPWTGSYLASVMTSGETVFAGTQYGVYISTDGGEVWKESSADIPMGPVISFAANGNVYFAGTALAGVFRSADKGRTWDAVNEGLTSKHARALAVSPDGNRLFVGTGAGVFRSDDNGTSWSPASQGLTNLGVRCLRFRDDGAMLYAGTGKGLFRTEDSGETWTRVTGGIDDYVEGIVYSGTTLVAVTLRGVFRSTNEGASWTKITAGLPSSNGYDIELAGSMLITGFPDGVYISTDDGLSWSPAKSGFPNQPLFRVFGLAATASGKIFAGTDAGVFRAEIAGMQWEDVNAGIPAVSMMTIASLGQELYAGTDGWGVYKSQDGGKNWTRFSAGLRSQYVRCLATDGVNMFAGTAGGVQRIAPGSEVWEEIDKDGLMAGIQSFAVGEDAQGNVRIFAGTGLGTFTSLDRGTTWGPCDFGPDLANVTAMTAARNPAGGSILFAGTTGSGIFVTSDYGATWTSANAGIENNDIVSMVSDSAYVYAGTPNGVYRTRIAGGGYAWSFMGLSEYKLYSLFAVPNGNGGTHLLAGTEFGGVHYSADNGLSWKEVKENMPESPVLAIALHGTGLYAGTHTRSVWSRPFAEITGGEPPIGAVYNLALKQNYPNPFMPYLGDTYMVFDYEVPAAGEISLKMFDMAGREAGTIVEGYSFAGYHTVTYDAAELPSGNYLYRLSANGQSITRRLIVVR